MQRTIRFLVCVVAALALTACSEDRAKTVVELDQSPSPETTPQETAGQEVPQEPPAKGVVRGLDPANSPDEQQVTDTWFSFWTELGRMYTEVTVDRAGFGDIARGEAFDGPAAYVEKMQGRSTRNQGGTIASVADVEVKGDRAVVKGCVRSNLIEVDADGRPTEFPTPLISSQETFERTADGWVVVRHEVLPNSKPCSYR